MDQVEIHDTETHYSTPLTPIHPLINASVRAFLPPSDSPDWEHATKALGRLSQEVTGARKFFSRRREYTIYTVDSGPGPRFDLLRAPKKNARMEKTLPHVLSTICLAKEFHRLYPKWDTARLPFWESSDKYDPTDPQISSFLQKFTFSTQKEEQQMRRCLQRGRRFHLFRLNMPGLCLLLATAPAMLDQLRYSTLLAMLHILTCEEYLVISDFIKWMAKEEDEYVKMIPIFLK
jgi:hypothetical protein